MNVGEDREIEFLLRFSLQSLADQRIKCPESWTVLQLKQHINETCPSKPAISLQRLIYSGHFLTNEQTLKDVFKRNFTEADEDLGLQVIHLVCSSQASPNTIPESSRNSTDNLNSTESHTHINVAQPIASLPVPDGVAPGLNAVYAQAYHDYLRQHYGQAQLTNRISRFSVVTRVQQNVEEVNAEQGIGNNAANQERPDMLELIYKIIRVLILVALFMYSPTERLVFVVLVICLMLYVQQRRERNNRAVPENPAPQNVPENEPVPNNASEQSADDQPRQNDLAPQSAWAVFWSTVVSFFSSLIPENQMPLNVN
ncbi:unnamed protein product [Bursaphelenchus okinawaensis]|uniref:Ubiquitin-like domain-containing protein n=1 Tax=Bursaphelenchus okinawaensis TaxID=465554 RepID=A0A811JT76_9BILA|nr:unnamed protein product [Bursaphelenchus okinawaensis]CAG9081886.1 unnamed protein product [Bursaphelenchus okinawaensis]